MLPYFFTFCYFQVFEGNEDSDTVVFNKLSQPITARYIRLLPIEWHNHISMRIEIYGCPGIIFLLCNNLYTVSLLVFASPLGWLMFCEIVTQNQKQLVMFQN